MQLRRYSNLSNKVTTFIQSYYNNNYYTHSVFSFFTIPLEKARAVYAFVNQIASCSYYICVYAYAPSNVVACMSFEGAHDALNLACT